MIIGIVGKEEGMGQSRANHVEGGGGVDVGKITNGISINGSLLDSADSVTEGPVSVLLLCPFMTQSRVTIEFTNLAFFGGLGGGMLKSKILQKMKMEYTVSQKVLE